MKPVPDPGDTGDDGDALNESKNPSDEVLEEAPGAEAEVSEEVVERLEDASTYQDRWLRAEADLQNFRRRSAKEREESRRYAEEAVMLDVIAALDDLDRALEAGRDAAADGAWLEGVELVTARMRDALSRRGVEVIDPVGQPFDPVFHEALMQVSAPDGVQPGEVAQVVLKGYRRDGRALRAARVVVARVPEESDG